MVGAGNVLQQPSQGGMRLAIQEKPDVSDIFDQLFKEERLTEMDKGIVERADFEEIGRILAQHTEEDVPFGPATASKILYCTYQKVPDVFERLGISARVWNFRLAPDALERDEDGVYRRNLETLQSFIGRLNNELRCSARFRLVTKQMSLFGSLDEIPERYRARFGGIVKGHETALKRAIGKGSDVAFYLRVFERDGSPYEVNVPLKLLDTGVSVYSWWDGSEKFGTIDTYKFENNWQRRLCQGKRNPSTQMLRPMATDTEVGLERLREILKGRIEPTYPEAVALDRYHRRHNGGLLTHNPLAVILHTEHFNSRSSPNELHPHREVFFGVLQWPSFCSYIDRHVQSISAQLMDRETMMRYSHPARSAGK